MVLNVLVADDSAVMRAMIIKSLRLSGLPLGDVHEASSGEEGLEVLDQNWVDLALVDLNMPDMNGEEMIEKLRENPSTSDLSVVVVSTEGSETRIERLLNESTQFIHKPFTPESLRETIMEAIGHRMGNKMEEELEKAGILTFQQLCFMFQAPELKDQMKDKRVEAAVSVKFRGSICGKLVVKAYEGLLPSIAANMLGEEGASSKRQQVDALGEMANVICGNLLPGIAGSEEVFHIHAPELEWGEEMLENDTGQPPVEVQLVLDEGRADLLLYLEGGGAL